ncbi:MAG TPA: hypothetical protein VMH26_15330 [Burkholderiales bacterium]|nr:hypothetical protein [Burkholderiales bacterium]
MPNANDAARDVDPARMFESMMDIPQAWSQMLDVWRRMAVGAAGPAATDATAAGGRGATGDPALDPQALMTFLAQSYMTVMGCGLRCLSGWAHIHSRHLASISRGMSAMGGGPGGSSQDPALMLDELRAYLRELMELPYHECRRALAELQSLEFSILPEARAGDHPRRWRAKA